MKNEALYHINHLIINFGFKPENIQLVKTKQSNKKPCYLTHFDLEKCSISGFVLQNDDKEWVFNFTQSSHNVTLIDFKEKVKTAEFLKRQLNRTLAKEAKINLSQDEIKQKDKQIRQERNFKLQ